MENYINENLPKLDYFKEEEESFIGEEYYPDMGFFSEKKLEYLLWKTIELMDWYPNTSDYVKTIDETLKFDKELDRIERKPFSVEDKKIFNTQILLARLRALLLFKMWKSKRLKGGC